MFSLLSCWMVLYAKVHTCLEHATGLATKLIAFIRYNSIFHLWLFKQGKTVLIFLSTLSPLSLFWP